DERHKSIYSAMQSLHAAHCQIDAVTLQSILSKSGLLSSVGGLEYISSLPDMASNASNWPFYASSVWDTYLLRRLIRTCHGAAGRAYEQSGDVDSLMTE